MLYIYIFSLEKVSDAVFRVVIDFSFAVTVQRCRSFWLTFRDFCKFRQWEHLKKYLRVIKYDIIGQAHI